MFVVNKLKLRTKTVVHLVAFVESIADHVHSQVFHIIDFLPHSFVTITINTQLPQFPITSVTEKEVYLIMQKINIHALRYTYTLSGTAQLSL